MPPKGFTLIEIFVAVAIVMVIVSVTTAALFGRRGYAELETTTLQIVSMLREAQGRAMTGEGGAAWGVRLDNSAGAAPFYALFQIAYSPGSVVERKILPSRVRFSSSSIPPGSFLEVIFASITGLPSAPTSIELELVMGGGGASTASSSIAITPAGLISF